MATAVATRLDVTALKLVSPGFYRPELDGLRFFAFLGVYIAHSLSPDSAYYIAHHVPGASFIASAVSAGKFGVDLFFFLSAYLITELLLREKERFGAINLRSFYLRRILRIWPLYLLGLLIAVLLPLVFPAQSFPLRYVLAFLLVSGNWVLSLRSAGILSIAGPASVMFILWSVSFEEQFYLFWPLIMGKTSRLKVLLYVSGLLLLVSTSWRGR